VFLEPCWELKHRGAFRAYRGNGTIHPTLLSPGKLQTPPSWKYSIRFLLRMG
jgi:hypothetical protein